MPLPNRVSPFGELVASPARGTLMGNRGGRLHDAQRKLTVRRWVTGLDLLQTRFQGSASRRLERRLHGIVFSRRGHGVCGRSSALLRVPPKRCRTVCTVVLRQEKTCHGCSHGSCPPCRAAERQRQADPSVGDRHFAGWCDDRGSWRSIGCTRRGALALECLGLFTSRATPARHRSRRAHAAVDPRCARARLHAALAFERALGLKAAQLGECSARQERVWSSRKIRWRRG
jgi:hypothetical protein